MIELFSHCHVQHKNLMKVFATYFHYFRGEHRNFAQWAHTKKDKDPKQKKGPEKWRRNIWIGARGDYPHIGPYDSTDKDVVRWQIRCAQAAGIDAFFLFMNNWEKEQHETKVLLDVAAQENFKIGFVEQHSVLGVDVRAIPRVEDDPPPIFSQKYEGYEEILKEFPAEELPPFLPRKTEAESPSGVSRSVAPDALRAGQERISGMLNRWKSHPAYLQLHGKPVIVIPYMVEQLTPRDFTQLVKTVKARVGQDLYIIGIVPAVYWYMSPMAILNKNKKKNYKKITQEWAGAGVDCFTHWTPNGMITANQETRLRVNRAVVEDSRNWGKESMIPMMPGFNDDEWQRENDKRAMTSPRGNGESWKQQIIAAKKADPNYLFIQSWNEWHEGSQIEPSVGYAEPYHYLKLLAEGVGKPWMAPADPPRGCIDSWMRPHFPVTRGKTRSKNNFLASELRHQIGRADRDRDGWVAATDQDKPGFLCFGPYTTDIPGGSHQARFSLMIDNNTADNNVMVTLDVYDATAKKLLRKRDVKRKDFKQTFQPQDFEIAFTNRAGHQLEFRTYWHRRAWINEHKVTVI